jgi:hypothetical protein
MKVSLTSQIRGLDRFFDIGGEILLNTQTPRNFVVGQPQAVKFCNSNDARIELQM